MDKKQNWNLSKSEYKVMRMKWKVLDACCESKYTVAICTGLGNPRGYDWLDESIVDRCLGRGVGARTLLTYTTCSSESQQELVTLRNDDALSMINNRWLLAQLYYSLFFSSYHASTYSRPSHRFFALASSIRSFTFYLQLLSFHSKLFYSFFKLFFSNILFIQYSILLFFILLHCL